jgi:uncharacterized protein (TIGR03067 family)
METVMRQILCSVVFLAFAFPLLADEKEDASKKMNGSYEVISMMKNGNPDNDAKDKIKFAIKDGVIVIKDGDRDESAKFTVDPSKKPAHIDIVPGKGSEKIVMGIYEFKETDKGAELTLSFNKDGKERPKDFKGEGEGTMVVKLLRKKEK